MKRSTHLVLLVALALVLSAIVPAGAQGGVTVVANANLTLRAGPSSSAESFGTVPYQTELEATAISSDRGWVAVAYNGQPGWLSLQYTGVVGGDLGSLPVSDEVFPPASAPAGAAAPAPTPPPASEGRHGMLRRNAIWSGSVYIVGDVIVPRTVTLTIAPGTTVWIAANQDVQNFVTYPGSDRQGVNTTSSMMEEHEPGEPFPDEPHHVTIQVLGTLHAVGTPEQPIVFTSDSLNPSPYDWNELVIQNGILSYATVEYNRMLTAWDGVVISHNTLRYAGIYTVGAQPGSSPVIEHNTMHSAGHELIYTNGGAPVIRNNVIGPNPARYGMSVLEPRSSLCIAVQSGAPQITGNVIQGCGEGIRFIAPPDPATIIEGNTFQDNGVDIRNLF